MVVRPGKSSRLMSVLVAASSQFDDFPESVWGHGELAPVDVVSTEVIEEVAEQFSVVEVQRLLVVLGQDGLELANHLPAVAHVEQCQHVDFTGPDLVPACANGSLMPTLNQKPPDKAGVGFLTQARNVKPQLGQRQILGTQRHELTPLSFQTSW